MLLGYSVCYGFATWFRVCLYRYRSGFAVVLAQNGFGQIMQRQSSLLLYGQHSTFTMTLERHWRILEKDFGSDAWFR